jgi:hypothetical protein
LKFGNRIISDVRTTGAALGRGRSEELDHVFDCFGTKPEGPRAHRRHVAPLTRQRSVQTAGVKPQYIGKKYGVHDPET